MDIPNYREILVAEDDLEGLIIFTLDMEDW
jgi:hypothetical protein